MNRGRRLLLISMVVALAAGSAAASLIRGRAVDGAGGTASSPPHARQPDAVAEPRPAAEKPEPAVAGKAGGEPGQVATPPAGGRPEPEAAGTAAEKRRKADLEDPLLKGMQAAGAAPPMPSLGEPATLVWPPAGGIETSGDGAALTAIITFTFNCPGSYLAVTDVRIDQAKTDTGEDLQPLPMGMRSGTSHRGIQWTTELGLRPPRKRAQEYAIVSGSFAMALDGPLRAVRLPLDEHDGGWQEVVGLDGALVHGLAPTSSDSVPPPQVQAFAGEPFALRTMMSGRIVDLFAKCRYFYGNQESFADSDLTRESGGSFVVDCRFDRRPQVTAVQIEYFDPARLKRIPFTFRHLHIPKFDPPADVREADPPATAAKGVVESFAVCSLESFQ
jgi:hypothetical protein